MIVILELAAGISGIVFKDKVYSSSETEYSKGWDKVITKYGQGDEDAINTVDALQSRVCQNKLFPPICATNKLYIIT